MLTQPTIVKREARPYVAIRGNYSRETISKAAERTLPHLYAWMFDRKLQSAGAPFFKYNRMPSCDDMEIEVGIPTHERIEATGNILSGMISAGRYATLTHIGPYEQLYEANARLEAWALEQGLRWDVVQTPQGDTFAGRFEIYETDPREVPDAFKYTTEVTIKLAD